MTIEITSARSNLNRRAASIAIGLALGVVAAAPMAAVVDSGPLTLAIPSTLAGVYLNWVNGATGASGAGVPGWDFNPYLGGGSLVFYWNNNVPNSSGCVAVSIDCTDLPLGAVIGPASNYSTAIQGAALNFRNTGSKILGFRFQNEGTVAVNYGYALIDTTASNGFPATITRYYYENSGGPITVGIVDSGPISIVVPPNVDGIYMNLVTGASGTTGSSVTGWDFNPYANAAPATPTLAFFTSATANSGSRRVVGSGTVASALPGGTVIGPASVLANAGVVGTVGTPFRATGTSNVGVVFSNETTGGTINYGYVEMATNATLGFPATITRIVYQHTGLPITITNPPAVVQSLKSRKDQGGAGTFDLTLSP